MKNKIHFDNSIEPGFLGIRLILLKQELIMGLSLQKIITQQ